MQNRRVESDIMKLMARRFRVALHQDDLRDFTVELRGPEDTPYENGVWNVRVLIPENYPFTSPSVGFETQIVHPNVELASGTICMDVLNEKWTPLYDLALIFEVFLPQLLKNPNPEDPLNHFAANALLKTPNKYRKIVKEHVKIYASPKKDRGESDSEISDLSSSEDSDK